LPPPLLELCPLGRDSGVAGAHTPQ
jgi:hypothetical protein